jgi:hypothetical protein
VTIITIILGSIVDVEQIFQEEAQSTKLNTICTLELVKQRLRLACKATLDIWGH